MPCYSDFSKILELMDVKSLYEEQKEKWGLRLRERDEQLQSLLHDVEWRERQLNEASGEGGANAELRLVEEEKARIVQEAQARIQQLNQRLAELNQKMGK